MMMVLVVEKGWKAVFSEHDTSTVQIHKSVTDPGIGNAGDDDFEDNDGNGGDDDDLVSWRALTTPPARITSGTLAGLKS